MSTFDDLIVKIPCNSLFNNGLEDAIYSGDQNPRASHRAGHFAVPLTKVKNNLSSFPNLSFQTASPEDTEL